MEIEAIKGNKDLEDNFGIKIPMEVIYNPIEIPQNTIIPEELNFAVSL